MFEFHGWAVIELPEDNHFDGFRGPADSFLSPRIPTIKP